jgi:PAS domain S-box-containing protein
VFQSMSHDIACKAIAMICEAMERRGLVIPDKVFEGVGLQRGFVFGPRNWMDWERAIHLLEELEKILGGPGEWEFLGEELFKTKTMAFMPSIMGFFVDVRRAYFMGAKWMGPAMFIAFHTKLEVLEDGRIRQLVHLPSQYRDCPQIFSLFTGMLRVLPSQFFGMGGAVVETEIRPHQASYTIFVPPQANFWNRVKRAFRSFFGSRALFEELAHQHAALKARYEELGRTRNEFRNVLDRSPLGNALVEDGRVLYTNPAWARFLGIEDARVLVGRNLADFVHLSQQAEFRAATKGMQLVATREWLFARADGKETLLELSWVPDVPFANHRSRLVVAREVSEMRQPLPKKKVA